MKNFLPLISEAKHGSEKAMETLIKDFTPLLIKESSRQGYLDEDCFQNLIETFIHVVRNFNPEKYIN
ncbi:TPA_asm: helix-turn-helix domain-containing protein [Listeria monocytogenes]|uniref:helix-turn-helix domain-containing protein n=1 Tax=Bacilli TaxID=91061 RepID=UPI00026C86E2|nr:MULTISPECIES: helix-turn-helix domain-containing protein [Bacilli]EAC4461041.1 helix-turn-helix domain-containing protein [Listeria monocytogenes]EAC6576082.1 helix-turn-helix domain-containing protein [Listeria monocytogenes]EAC6588755.1 helix-turn-helix domain-containing protein [Listeria monocytogenes]EAD5699843.1 helix-turn-helix domain-containing protein [Listeria monocytogenes]EAD5702708.1 helix-turn-helix domain-containing protein [Listeria monocytogenes]